MPARYSVSTYGTENHGVYFPVALNVHSIALKVTISLSLSSLVFIICANTQRGLQILQLCLSQQKRWRERESILGFLYIPMAKHMCVTTHVSCMYICICLMMIYVTNSWMWEQCNHVGNNVQPCVYKMRECLFHVLLLLHICTLTRFVYIYDMHAISVHWEYIFLILHIKLK